MADITGNGRNDLIVANQGAPTLLFLNNGNTTNPLAASRLSRSRTSMRHRSPWGMSSAMAVHDLIVGVMSTDPNQPDAAASSSSTTGSATNPFSSRRFKINGADLRHVSGPGRPEWRPGPDLVVGQSGLVSNGTTYRRADASVPEHRAAHQSRSAALRSTSG